ncbi:Uncharacterised protein [Mycobacterium tuberculosis]|nr:Uncharacterised protein [Mycobacterium tuberculosis]COW96507.1 Uncharacterised protein [Mycobacterium tuberculosis]
MFAASVGKMCRTVSNPSNGSGCSNVVVTVARLLTSCVSTSRFLAKNGRATASKLSNCWMAFDRSASEWVNLSVNSARFLFNATNCSSS